MQEWAHRFHAGHNLQTWASNDAENLKRKVSCRPGKWTSIGALHADPAAQGASLRRGKRRRFSQPGGDRGSRSKCRNIYVNSIISKLTSARRQHCGGEMRLREAPSIQLSHIDRRERGTRRLRVAPKVKVACIAPERRLETRLEKEQKNFRVVRNQHSKSVPESPQRTLSAC